MKNKTKIILLIIGLIWLVFLLFLINDICDTLNAATNCIAPGDCGYYIKSCGISFWIIGYLILGIPSWVLFLIIVLSKGEKVKK
jgi:hypothetical protein